MANNETAKRVTEAQAAQTRALTEMAEAQQTLIKAFQQCMDGAITLMELQFRVLALAMAVTGAEYAGQELEMVRGLQN